MIVNAFLIHVYNEQKEAFMNPVTSKKIKTMTSVALMTAVLCILSPLSVPIGPVPVSLAVLAVLLCAYALPPLQAGMASFLYLILGLAGLPVFAGYTAGPGRLLGPTGGYIIGFIFLALISSFAIKQSYAPTRGKKADHIPQVGVIIGLKGAIIQLAGMLIGMAVLYAFGTAWFVISKNVPAVAGDAAGGMTVAVALAKCVTPFVAIDLLKVGIAFVVGNALHLALTRAGLMTAYSD